MQHSSRRTSLNARQAKKLAVLLKARRDELGLSMNRLMALTGVNDATIHRLEHGGIRAPQPETLRALGSALNLTSYELFTACEWISADELPGLGAYLRTKYRDLSDADIAELQDQLHELTRDGTQRGPRGHEDELI